SIAQLIDDGFRQLEHKVVARKVTEDESATSSAIVLPRDHPDYDILKRGNLVIHQGKVGIIDYSGTEKIINPEPVIKDTDHAFHFTGLRNSLVRLVQSELDGDVKNMKAYRAELNNQYDLFAFRYGNHPSNKKLILFDAEGFKVLS